MTGLLPWLGWGLAGLLALGIPLLVYLKRELPVRGRVPLALLRGGALLVIVALLVNPTLPGQLGGGATSWVLLDASSSMSAGGQASAWSRAGAVLEEMEGPDGRILLFGAADPTPLSGGLDTLTPALPTSRLVPALERAAESGARSLVLVSDLRLDDPDRALTLLDELGLGLRIQDVGEEVPNAAVSAFELPEAVEEGEEPGAVVTVEGAAPSAGDTATVELREEDRVVDVRQVVLPDPGRRLRLEVALPPPASGGDVRYTATVRLAGDAWAGDDARSAWTSVDPEEGALVLVSLSPDWESRFLLPALGEATALRIRGFLRVGDGRWLETDGDGAGGTVESGEVIEIVREARLLVVQGGSPAAPDWLREAVDEAPALLVLARSASDAALAGVEAERPLQGEWYVDPELPPSPLAGALAGAPLEGLPPLGPLVPVTADPEQTPLVLRRGTTEPGRAALVLEPGAERRRAVWLAPGTWRWAFRSQAGREAYRRLWSGIAGWLLAGAGPGGGTLRPVDRVVQRGAPVQWSAGAAAGDSLGLRLHRVGPADTADAGEPVVDTVLTVPETGRFATGPLSPGTYRYRGGPPAADSASEGRFEVEGWTGELLRPRTTVLADREPRIAAAGPGGRPLRTHPLPYILVLSLLSAEWIARRRKGLR